LIFLKRASHVKQLVNDSVLRTLCEIAITRDELEIKALVETLQKYTINEVRDCLNWHKFPSLVWHPLKGLNLPLRPKVKAYLNRASKQSIVSSMAQKASITSLDKLLSDSNIDYLVFKGVILSQILHDTPLLRHSKDNDIWVSDAQIEELFDCLSRHGYQPITDQARPHGKALKGYLRQQKDMVFSHPKYPHAPLEVHWRLDKNRFAYQMEFGAIFKRKELINIDQTDHPSFGTHTYLTYLCTHGSLAMWGRFKWLLDWYFMVEKAKTENYDWNKLLSALDNSGHTQCAIIAFRLSNIYLNQTIPTVFKSQKLTLGCGWVLRMIVRNATQNKYPALASRWVSRLFIIKGRRYVIRQFTLALSLLIWRY
jgi:hypothetical protein